MMTKQLSKLISKLKFVSKRNTIITDKKAISSLAPKVLTEKEEIDKIQPYLDKLKEAVDEKGINNIALMGNYGSGKSTIIKTFQDQNGQYEYLNISLASFSRPKRQNEIIDAKKSSKLKGKSSKGELDRMLEVSILQQIFYHVKPSEIPKSRFKRIIEFPLKELVIRSALFVLWIICLLLFIKYNYLNKINPDTWNVNESFDLYAFFILLITFFGLVYASICIIEIFSNSKITKVNIKGELELGEDISKSILNEHLDEIFYFFEKTSYNVIIIEDLDRFESTDIFTKLREINILLNNSKSINREIKFVYAVGDFLFKNKKERVKFFEYIIPVIPFINASNAESQLKKLIKEAKLEETIFSKDFISDVVTFIDDIDMRLLLNIFHEFVIYRNTLKPVFVRNNEELFAIIIYKNTNPEDFAKLSGKKGKLFGLIHNKKNYIKELIQKIDDEIGENINKIRQIESEPKETIEDLQPVYLMKLIEKVPANALVKKEEITKDFSKIIAGTGLIAYNEYGRQTSYKYDFSKIEKEVDPNNTYEERAKFIKDKQNNVVDSLKLENEKLRTKRVKIQNLDLKQIFSEIDINQYLDKSLNNGLFRNLILNGYINENYNDYISLFHEGGALTKEDSIFEKKVRGGYTTDYKYKLTNIENLVNNLDSKYFERDVILNFDLLSFLGKNYDEYSTDYNSIIGVLSNEKEKSIDFIDQYIDNEDITLEIFIEKLATTWKGLCEYVYNQSDYTEDKKDKYLGLVIRFAKNDSIIANQNTTVLAEAIEKNPDFLSLVKDIEKVKIEDLLTKLKIKLESLAPPNEETKPLFDYVYQNEHYKINTDNISLLLKTFRADIVYKNINERHYTTILESDCEALIEYVNSNINTYIKNVFLKLSDNKLEAESILISLLNNKELKTNLKIQIIQKTGTVITNLEEIEDVEIKKQLLIYNKVTPLWDNVTHYYSTVENNIDEALVEFLNTENVYTELGEERMPKSSDGFSYPNFRETIILCNEISYDSYTTILRGSNYQRKFISNGELNVDENKVKFLAENIFATTKENYDLLRDNHGDYHIILIEKGFEAFVDQIDDFETDGEDVLLILKSEKIDDANKLRYIPLISDQLITNYREVSKLINRLIINNDTKVELSSNTLKAIIENYSSIEDNIKLINIYYDDLEGDDIVHLVSSIGTNYKRIFYKRSRTSFYKTSYNKKLFERLDSDGLISSVRPERKNTETKLRVTGRYH